MATGHILPGFGNPVSRLKRVQVTGYPVDNQKLAEMRQNSTLSSLEFDQIRDRARQMWSRRDREPTTYNFYYSGQEIPEDERTQSRPVSPTRRNNPHPPQIFLTNRLRYIEGYQNPDATIGKDCYRIDASVSSAEQDKRRRIKLKYTSRPDPALVGLYKDRYGLKEYMNPTDAQAAEAWLNIADDKDKNDVVLALQKHKEKQEREDTSYQVPNRVRYRTRTAYPSLHRWMKQAGASESESLARIMHSLDSNPDRCALKPYRSTVGFCGDMRAKDIAATRRFSHSARSSRGDFLMHPDWPPTIPHHFVP